MAGTLQSAPLYQVFVQKLSISARRQSAIISWTRLGFLLLIKLQVRDPDFTIIYM